MTFLRYAVRVDGPKHIAEIELRFPVDGKACVTLPAWSPGSYLIRDYARYVRDLTATAEDGSPRAAAKIDKTTWQIDATDTRELVVRYAVYGNDLSVRTNHIDATHAFLHAPATFMHPTHLRGPCEVEVTLPDGWKLHAATLRAQDIDELYDTPILAGITKTFPIAAKVPCELAIWGARAPGGIYDEARLVTDLAAIVDDHVARFGEAPFDRYTFLLMLAHDAYGGLEHRASSANLYHPHFGSTRKSYENLLELLSHELFHAWNGKRIAPRPLLHIDYTREAYTRCLWVMEGLTSHYDRVALRSSQRISAKSLLEKVLDDWARLQATPGRARHSLEQASFDAWIKLYRPDESNVNTTVSYYLKGGLVMFALDLQIRRRTEGARSLDDVLRLLWQRFGKPREPHPDDLQPIFEEASGLALADVFDNQIRGTSDPDLATELAHVGLELRASHDPAQVADGATPAWLGVTTTGVKVTHVFDGSPAHAAGITPGDELIAFDGFRAASESDLRSLTAARCPGDKVLVHAFRRHRLVELCAVIGHAPPTRYEIAGIADAGPRAARFQAWLGEPHPGAQNLATITTTTRWV
jgi:predicted metalloprotease with PDZ domain